ncbi:hypothetical protein Tco_0968382 [Tanacetum coccineum]
MVRVSGPYIQRLIKPSEQTLKRLIHGSKIGKSTPAKDPVEEPTDKVIMDEQPTEDILISDEGHVLNLEDTDNAHMLKVSDTTTLFRPIPEEERYASPEPDWGIPPIDLPEADNNWANAFAKAYQDPDENKLHNKIDDIGLFIRWLRFALAFWLLKTAFWLLRFASRFGCVLPQDHCVLPQDHCVLLQDHHCVLLQHLVAFCLKTILRFD